MAHDYKKLDDNEIVKLVDDNVRTSTGYASSDLAKEREKVLQYYNANCRNRRTTETQVRFSDCFQRSTVNVCGTARNLRSW